MSARLVWIAQCEVCDATDEFDGTLNVEELGSAAREEGWETPPYGGLLCQRCSRAVKTLSEHIT